VNSNPAAKIEHFEKSTPKIVVTCHFIILLVTIKTHGIGLSVKQPLLALGMTDGEQISTRVKAGVAPSFFFCVSRCFSQFSHDFFGGSNMFQQFPSCL